MFFFCFFLWQQYASVKSAVKSRYNRIYRVDVVIDVNLLNDRKGQNLCAWIVTPKACIFKSVTIFPYPAFFSTILP